MKKLFIWKKLLGAATATTLVAAAVLTGSTAASAETFDQQDIRNGTNDYRHMSGLPMLDNNEDLNDVAQAWAEHLAEVGVLNHNPNVGSEIPSGYAYWGENVATGYPTPVDSVDGWWFSPSHRANMLLEDATDIGSGYALDKNGVSWAVEIIVKYPKGPKVPGSVGTVSASVSDGTTVNASWGVPADDGGSAVTGYHVRFMNTTTGAIALEEDVTADVTSSTFTGAAPGSTYTVTVTPVNGVGAGAASTSGEVLVPAVAPAVPGAPQLSVADPYTLGVAWSAPEYDGGSAISSYTVELTSPTGSARTTDVDGSTLSAQFTDLAPDAVYSARVQAVNEAGVSPWSASSNSVKAPRTVASGVNNLTASLVGTDSISGSWSAPGSNGGSPVLGYTAYLIESETGNITADASLSADETTATFKNVTPGVSYLVNVVANNAQGVSGAAESNVVSVPAVVPAAPVTPAATVSDINQVTVSWVAPFDGGSPITSYVVTLTPKNGVPIQEVATAGATSYIFNDLTSGTSYTATVAAVNAVGTGASSPVSEPADVPADPTVADSIGELEVNFVSPTEVTVNWVAPEYNGGSAIKFYTVTITDTYDNVLVSEDVDGLTFNWKGASRNTAYNVSVTSTNGVGESKATNLDFRTRAAAPSVPSDVTATVISGTAVDVTWATPSDNGGSAITGYKVNVYDAAGSFVKSVSGFGASDLSASVSGLNPGSSYTFTVVASNKDASSVDSSESAVVTTWSAPSAPRNVVSSLTGNSVDITWDAPLNNGGAVVTGYEVTLTPADGGAAIVRSVVDAGVTVNGLKDGAVYSVAVQAVNSVGAGKVGSGENVEVPAVAPGVPQNVKGVAGDGSVTVNWEAPASDGGSPVTQYVVTLFDADGSQAGQVGVNGDVLTVKFTDLTPGASYTARVAAVNKAGESANSVASASVVVPALVPDAPTIQSVQPQGDSLQVTWFTPANNGGAAIDSYRVTLTDGSNTLTQVTSASVTQYTFAGLKPGATYTAKVSAHNATGWSVESQGVNVTLPAVQASAPRNVVATATNNTVSATWDAPLNDGGSPVTGYKAYLNKGGVTVDTKDVTERSVTFDADFATEYQVRVKAVTSVGVGATGVSDGIVTNAVVPTAPQNVTAALTDTGVITVNFEAPANSGGSAITKYAVSLTSSTDALHFIEVDGVESTQFKGLKPGSTYVAEVVAVNGVGASAPGAAPAVKVPAVVPAAATGVVLTSNTPSSIQVDWKAPGSNGGADISSYTVTLVDSEGNVSVLTVTGNSTSVVFPGVKERTSYTASVVATNEAGVSPVSAASNTLVTPPVTAPAAPGDNTLNPGNSGNIKLISVTADSITVEVPNSSVGDWVYGYAFSTPSGLGWAQVGLNKQVTFPLTGANLAAGSHTLSVQNLDGSLNGWVGFTVAAVPVPNPESNNNPGNNSNTKGSDATPAGESVKELPNTGLDALPYGVMAMLFLGIGGALVVTRRVRASR